MSVKGLLPLHVTTKLLHAEFSVTGQGSCAQHEPGPAIIKAPMDLVCASLVSSITLRLGGLVPRWTERFQGQRWPWLPKLPSFV